MRIHPSRFALLLAALGIGTGCSSTDARDAQGEEQEIRAVHGHELALPLFIQCDEIRSASTVGPFLDHHLFSLDRFVNDYVKGSYQRYASAIGPDGREMKTSKGLGLASFAPSEADGQFAANAVSHGRAIDGFKVVDIPNFIFGGDISIAPGAVSTIHQVQGVDLHYQPFSKTVACKKITKAEAAAFKLD
jgi:hypothetical protein